MPSAPPVYTAFYVVFKHNIPSSYLIWYTTSLYNSLNVLLSKIFNEPSWLPDTI